MAPVNFPSIEAGDSVTDVNYDNPFDNNSKRRKFVMLVYSVLCVCISVTAVHVAFVIYCTDFRNFLFQHQYIIWIALIAYCITSLVVSCCMPVLRNPTVGIIVLVILVESLSLICAMTTMFYETHIILAAAIGTALLCYVITMVAIFVPVDLTSCYFLLSVMGILFFLFVIISTIVSIFLYVPILQLIVAFVTVIVFSVYLTYTTQMILGGKSFQFAEDDFLAAAIFLYIDIVIIFLNLLYIFQYFCEN